MSYGDTFKDDVTEKFSCSPDCDPAQFATGTIKAGTFAKGKVITLSKKLTMEDYKFTCQLTVRYRNDAFTNLPVRVHSDASVMGRIDMDGDHSFSCDVQYGGKITADMHPIGFIVDFFEKNPLDGWK